MGFRQALAPIVQHCTAYSTHGKPLSMVVERSSFSFLLNTRARVTAASSAESAEKPVCLLMIHRLTGLGSGPWRRKRLRCGFPIVECHGGWTSSHDVIRKLHFGYDSLSGVFFDGRARRFQPRCRNTYFRGFPQFTMLAPYAHAHGRRFHRSNNRSYLIGSRFVIPNT